MLKNNGKPVLTQIHNRNMLSDLNSYQLLSSQNRESLKIFVMDGITSKPENSGYDSK